MKPDGLWGIDDTDPMTIHHMQVELLVEAATLAIVDVQVAMHVHPQIECTAILPAYQQLIGLSIARGFTPKVREMFGGPRACTHIGALLNAMAPVAIQSLWSFFQKSAADLAGPSATADDVERNGLERNRNTCHVWADDGPMFSTMQRGGDPPVPLWARHRLAEKGVPVEIWRKSPVRP